MVTRKKTLAIVLAVIMVTAAGCAGWGSDGPADGTDGDQNDSSQSDDSERTDGEAQTDETNDSSADSGAGNGNDGGSDTDGADGGDGDSSNTDDDESGTSDGDDDDGASDGNGDTDGDDSSGDGDDDSNADGDESNDSDEQGTLTITVENESGEPVEDMIIAGIGPNELRHDGLTDENGQVMFELPDGEYYWVTDTEGTGYAGDEASVTMDGTDKSITMTVTPQTSDLTVTVYDHEGNPLPDATVSVVTDPGTGGGEDVGSATTNESGVAEFEVEHGAYEISASHDQYSAAGIAGPIDVSQGSESVDVMMPDPNDGDEDDTDDENETNDNDLETHTLTVRTPGAPDGTAITVQREAGPDEESDPITKASAGGQASFNVPPGHYHAEADGYNPTMVPIEVSDDTEITLQQPGPDPIQVTVVDAEMDEPIEGAEISGLCQLWYSSGDVYVTGTTDANGVAQAQAGVAPTECNARVEANGYETTHLSLSVPDDDGTTVEMTPAPADDGGTDNRTADENQTAVQAIAS